ncbi:protein phosphatase [Carnobacterium iners]|uniref:protein-serine/threonine phosphatase n=1 Tax=Carnobacterium iners TaxID=1073423 RepID=A0A1X7NJH3_9LACT|nr:Stp1/IreP family PP2C-type Ser/Thr phosphatase [Carnobacterium iners]SEK83822.1 protein phosphatase [Carnobacterium iners]SMH37956.1 protein phosphatase [Carnobacterium iners]
MHIFFQSDIGKKRKNNQDFANYFENNQGIPLAVLCDGMGGHKAGDIASEMAVSHLGDAWENSGLTDVDTIVEWIKEHINIENTRIVEKSTQYPDLEGMGTTLVAVALVENHFIVANVGDSRAYHFINGNLKQVTDDHSLVNELLKSGEITTEAAMNHPQKNILTRSLGVTKKVDVDIVTTSISTGNQLLLCSDGLTNMVNDKEIAKILTISSTSLKEKVSELVSLANANGGYDNVTVMLIEPNKGKEGKWICK